MFSTLWRQSTALLYAVLGTSVVLAADEPLTLDEAVRKALASSDPYLSEPAERAAAVADNAVADGQLPDPKLRMAFANWPTNSFSYSQEPMTQLQLGVSQAFPRGDTRRLKREKRQVQAVSLRQQQAVRALEIVRDTRLAWLDLYFWQASTARVNDSRRAIDELISVTQSNFAAGKNKSQDIFRAQMELALLDDRLLDIAQKGDMAQARLVRRIGGNGGVKVTGHPTLRHPSEVTVAKELLIQHPAVTAKRSSIEAADKDVALAGEQYKPGWAVNVGYGARGGDRADFASVGVTMDVPLFTKNRQDKRLSAAKKSRQAQQLSLNAVVLDMERRLMATHAIWSRSAERIALYEQVVRERAKDTSAASLASYQSGVTDFPELVRARLAELEIELKLLALNHERLKAQAELLFLEGEDDA